MKPDDPVNPLKVETNGGTLQCVGITARDHIAIEAMNGLLAADVDNIHTHQNIAEMAYEQADVMIAESEK